MAERSRAWPAISILAVVSLPLLSVGVFATPPSAQPILRNGSCPGGYYASGNYCVPTSSGKFALPRDGSCPGGYYASGNYCVATDSANLAIPRSGSCPGGYYASGNYCLRAR